MSYDFSNIREFIPSPSYVFNDLKVQNHNPNHSTPPPEPISFWNSNDFLTNAFLQSNLDSNNDLENAFNSFQNNSSPSSLDCDGDFLNVFDDSSFDQLMRDISLDSLQSNPFDVSPMPSLISSPGSINNHITPTLENEFEPLFEGHSFLQSNPFGYLNDTPILNENSPLLKLQEMMRKRPYQPQLNFIETTFTSQTPLFNSTHKSKEPASSEIYKCNFPSCGKTFSFMRSLQSHLMSHSDDRQFGCPQCEARFKRMADLNRHCRSMHSNGSNHYSCPHGCGKGFPRSDALKRHLKPKPIGSKFACPFVQQECYGKVNSVYA